jgi:hypothetical protein
MCPPFEIGLNSLEEIIPYETGLAVGMGRTRGLRLYVPVGTIENNFPHELKNPQYSNYSSFFGSSAKFWGS